MLTPPDPAAPPSRAWAWFLALRPKTLVAGSVPVLVGSALAWKDHAFHPLAAAAALVGALLIQVGTNLANDYHDHRRGADAPDRAGPPRASASGWIKPHVVLGGALVAFGLATLAGLYLIAVAGWPILLIGLASLASGYAYTGGPYPLGYHGWGDVFVLAFFGPVAVAGTYYVQALATPPPHVWVASVAIGTLATAILVVNNDRDRDTDARAGKRTLAVRLGRMGTRVEYSALLLAAFLVPPMLWLMGDGPGALLPLLSLPVAAILLQRFHRAQAAPDSQGLLGGTAFLLFLYGLLVVGGVFL